MADVTTLPLCLALQGLPVGSEGAWSSTSAPNVLYSLSCLPAACSHTSRPSSSPTFLCSSAQPCRRLSRLQVFAQTLPFGGMLFCPQASFSSAGPQWGPQSLNKSRPLGAEDLWLIEQDLNQQLQAGTGTEPLSPDHLSNPLVNLESTGGCGARAGN